MASIHRQLSHSCQTAESEMLLDRTCGQKREVDLVIRSSVAGCELIISVECTDRQRPASVEWVEQLHAKHGGLATNKLILISRGGFTEAATAKANSLGVEPFSLEEARKVEWAKCVDRYSKVFLIAIDARMIVRVKSPTYNSGTNPFTFPWQQSSSMPEDAFVPPQKRWRMH